MKIKNEKTLTKRVQQLRDDLDDYIEEIGHKGKYTNAYTRGIEYEYYQLLDQLEIYLKSVKQYYRREDES